MRLEDFLSQNCRTETFAKGEIVAMQGEQAEAAYIIKSGRVAVFRKSGGRDLVLADLGEEEIFGEMAVLRFDEYTMSVRAEEETELYVIPPDLIHDYLRQAHPLIRKIMDTLLDRMKEVNQVLVDLDRVS